MKSSVESRLEEATTGRREQRTVNTNSDDATIIVKPSRKGEREGDKARLDLLVVKERPSTESTAKFRHDNTTELKRNWATEVL